MRIFAHEHYFFLVAAGTFVWHPNMVVIYPHDHRFYRGVTEFLPEGDKVTSFKTEKKPQHDLLSALINVRRQDFARARLTLS